MNRRCDKCPNPIGCAKAGRCEADQRVAPTPPALGIGRVATELYGEDWEAPYLEQIGTLQRELEARYDEARRVYYERLASLLRAAGDGDE